MLNPSIYEKEPHFNEHITICHSVLLSSLVGDGILFIAEKDKIKLKTETQIGKDSELDRIEF